LGRCEVCGNEYDKTFEVTMPGDNTHTFDCFESHQLPMNLTYYESHPFIVRNKIFSVGATYRGCEKGAQRLGNRRETARSARRRGAKYDLSVRKAGPLRCVNTRQGPKTMRAGSAWRSLTLTAATVV